MILYRGTFLDLVGAVVVDVAHNANLFWESAIAAQNGARRAVRMELESVLACLGVRSEDI